MLTHNSSFKSGWIWNRAIKAKNFRERKALFLEFPKEIEAFEAINFLTRLPFKNKYVRKIAVILVRDYLARYGSDELVLLCLKSQNRLIVTSCTRGLQNYRKVETLSVEIRKVLFRNARTYLKSWLRCEFPYANERTVRTYVKTIRLLGDPNDLPLLYELQKKVGEEHQGTLAPEKIALAISKIVKRA